MDQERRRRSLANRFPWRVPDSSSFFVRLLLGLVALILLTTLSAGVPAYLVTRGQLQRQARQHLDDIRQSSVSLYMAEYRRIVNQLTLVSERQTFRRLAAEFSSTEMDDYVEVSRQQSGLDVLIYCGPDAALISRGMDLAHCPADVNSGFRLLAGRPALVVTRQATLGGAEDWYTLLGAIWLTEPFLRQMAANTGAEHGLLLLSDLRRLVSSQPSLLPVGPEAALPARRTAQMLTRTDSFLRSDDQRFLTTVLPLTGADDQTDLLAEITLPIDELRRAEQRAAAILLASTTLVAILGVMAGALYIRRLTAPLQRLTGAAERVSQGDFATPLPEISGPSEATTLAAALRRSQTAMVNALDEREQARDWLNTLIQSIVEGVLTVDADGRVAFMSQGCERILGSSQQHALGQPINDLLQLPAGSSGAFLDQVAPDGERRQIEALAADGRRLVLAVTCAWLAAPNDQAEGAQMAIVLRDVTAEETVRNLRSYFLANISHEFRTPLSTLSASMELLLDENENLSADEMRKLLRPSHLSLISLQTLIDNLLESSSIEAGFFTIRLRPVNLNQIITEALHIVNPLLLRRRQALSLVEPARLPELAADAPRLTQALVNLLSNASKYSPIGESIELRIDAAHDSIRVSVADRGSGVSEGDRALLFQRFVRLDDQSGEQYGIGLGLHVVKTIVEAHGGRLGVDSRPGGGSVFWFELPLLNSANQDKVRNVTTP